MRVSRAVEKLRGFFGRRGLALSAVAVAVLLDAHAAPAAPAALGARLTPAALRAAPRGTAALSRQTLGSALGERAKSAVPVLLVLAIWVGGGACLVKAVAEHRSGRTAAPSADAPAGPPAVAGRP